MSLYDLVITIESTWIYSALLVYFAWYPIATSAMWIYTAFLFYRRREKVGEESSSLFYKLKKHPKVSFVIPAYNEEANIVETLEGVLAVDYPDFEVVVVDDCSSDGTLTLLQPFADRGRIRLIRKRVNEGKAMALNDAIPLCNGELLFIMDADAIPAADILQRMVPHFDSPRVAGVTGNPRVVNLDSFLAKLQSIEFASIISLMRRAQRVWGRIMTMSGVVGIFRREALQDVGYYSPEMATEDIDITWRLQIRHWDIRYESSAVMWMRVPQSFKGLWRQRRRWALGLSQVLHRHWRTVLKWEHRRFWPVLLEANLSVIWAYTYVLLSLVWIVGYALGHDPKGASPVPSFWGMLIASVCVIQLLIGVLLDRGYDKRLPRYFVVAVYYPLIYWILMAVITVTTHPLGASVNRQKKRYTLWKPVRE